MKEGQSHNHEIFPWPFGDEMLKGLNCIPLYPDCAACLKDYHKVKGWFEQKKTQNGVD